MTAGQRLPRSLWLLLIATFTARTGFFVESFLTIFMKSDAGFSAGEAGLIMSLYGLGGAVSTFCSGPIVDRFGPKALLLVSILSTAGAAAALALGPPHWLIAPIVLCMGAVGQIIMPASNTYVAQVVPYALQRRAYSLMFVALNSGLAVGPLLGGWLSSVSFSAMFAAGTLLLVAGGILSSLLDIPRRPETDRPPLRAGAFSSTRFVLGDRLFIRFALENCLFMVVYLQVFVTLPLFMLIDDLSPQSFGIIMAVNGAALVVLQLPVDHVLRRFSSRHLLTVGAILLAIGIGLNFFAGSVWAYLLIALVWTAGELINMPLAASISAGLARPEIRGSYLAIHGMAFPLGMMFASLIGGAALSFLESPKLLWLVLAGVGALLAYLRWRTGLLIAARLIPASE